MRRLWVRLSLLYTMVIVVVVMFLIGFLLITPSRDEVPADADFTGLSAEQIEAVELLVQTGLANEFMRTILSAQLFVFCLMTIVLGVAASIWMSYRMTRPLTTLQDAATRLGGQRDLSYRVTLPNGTAEMTALADSFNVMASELESAEKRRQNLLADVSHELRTPLTVLQGNLRAALDDESELSLPLIAKLYDQTRQLNHLIDDLHDLAQAEANRLPLNKTTIDLGELVAQAGDIFAPLAESEGIALHIETPQIVTPFKGDRARLMQVLQNLVANGLRYAHSELRLSLAQSERVLHLRVSDDGIGIEEQHLSHIFDRFYRADKSRTRESGGTGLGLAIVKSIVEAHGGIISAESQPNVGTTMTMAFPLD